MSNPTKILTVEAGQVLVNKIKGNQSSITTINTTIDRLSGTGEGSVAKQIADAIDGIATGTGGGAIPAYVVGDTMTKGWLSLTEGGTALTPVDKQEYVILSSGDWLRKHVMWFEDLEVYRLTGKVGIVSNVQRAIVTDTGTKSQTLNGSGYRQTPYNADNVNANEATATYTANNVLLNLGGTVRFVFDYRVEVNRNIFVKFGDVILDTLTSSGTSTNKGRYDKTFTVKPEHIGKVPNIERAVRNASSTYRFSGVAGIGITYDYIDDYTDYETDDIIDITESEVERLWGETGGMPNPNNNVFSFEERQWGYWVDGKPIYRKTIDFGTLPNNTTKTVNHGISNLNKVIDFTMWAFDGTYHLVLPYTSSGNLGLQTEMWVEASGIKVKTAMDGSNYSESYVTLYYTKSA